MIANPETFFSTWHTVSHIFGLLNKCHQAVPSVPQGMCQYLWGSLKMLIFDLCPAKSSYKALVKGTQLGKTFNQMSGANSMSKGPQYIKCKMRHQRQEFLSLVYWWAGSNSGHAQNQDQDQDHKLSVDAPQERQWATSGHLGIWYTWVLSNSHVKGCACHQADRPVDEALKLDLEIAKDAHYKSKKESKANKDDDSSLDVAAAKVMLDKTWKVWHKVETTAEVSLDLLNLYIQWVPPTLGQDHQGTNRNCYLDSPQGWNHTEQWQKRWKSFLSCVTFHLMKAFRQKPGKMWSSTSPTPSRSPIQY